MKHPPVAFELSSLCGRVAERERARLVASRVRELAVVEEVQFDLTAGHLAELDIDELMKLS